MTGSDLPLECAWFGAASTSTPIVLLHEGLGSVSMWRDFPDALASATGRQVLAYSRFGHGQSAAPAQPHTVDFMHGEADVLVRVLDAAGLDRAVLFGHSDGGSIALIFAAQHGARAAALVLEAPHVFVEDLSVESIAATTAEYRHGALRPRLARHHRDVDVAFHGWSDVWLHPDFRQWNLEALLPQITCPMLLIQGEGDEYGTLRQVDAIRQQVRGPVESLVLPSCGHSPHRDQRERVLSATTAFLHRRA